MSHTEQVRYVTETMRKYHSFVNGSVLEIGSLDVNGTIRGFFTTDRYVGVDVHEGRCVDVVMPGHLYDSDEPFDVVCSTECFEHDEHYPLTLNNMYRLLRPGGLFFFTCAGEGRKEHGTRRTGALWGTSPDYYQNLTEEMVREVLSVDECFSEYEFGYNSSSKDLYFRGLKK